MADPAAVPGTPSVAAVATAVSPDFAPPAPTPPAPTRSQTVQAMAPGTGTAQVFDPWTYRLSSTIRDPLFTALHNYWSDRQQHGRVVYDTMYKHPAVSAPFDSLITVLKSYRAHFKPAGTEPSEKQKKIAAFANEQLRRLGSTGDPRQGYERLIDWVGQGLKYGFSLAEMETVQAPWDGQSRIQVKRVIALPQASLDNNITVFEELGQGLYQSNDIRYRCFELDNRGTVIEVRQFYTGITTRKEENITWRGHELLRILHFVHAGTEGNPFGQSMFFTAFYAWAALYTIEQMEEAFLDASLPYLTASYETPDGRPSPELHAQFLDIIKKQDPALRALIMPDTTFGSVAPSNPSFTEHTKLKKDELRRYILNSILGVPIIQADGSNELDARNVIQVFFKYLVPGLQREIATLLTWQFARRLIDANWSGLTDEDYPELVFQNMLDNDLRVAMPLLQMVLPMVDSDRLGELLEKLMPGFDRSWIPQAHTSSVEKKRMPVDPGVSGKKGSPPTKQEGTPDGQTDGRTGNLGGDVDTKA